MTSTAPCTYAWRFDHGSLHRFRSGEEPWCTAARVPPTAVTAEQAAAAKQAAYGDARFLADLSAKAQLKIITDHTDEREGH